MRIDEMVRIASIFAVSGKSIRDFRLAAIGLRSDGVMVMARNEPSTKITPLAHAEARLIRKLGKQAKIVIVVRVTRNTNSLAMAKPCPRCYCALRNAKVRKVYFTNETGKIEKLF